MYPGYLCLGGIELANHQRTLAYLRTLGMPLMVAVPGNDCPCESADEALGSGDISFTIGFDVSDPINFTFHQGSFNNQGPWTMLGLAQAPHASSPGVRPPTPTEWGYAPGLPQPFFPEPDSVGPYGAIGSGAGFTKVRLANAAGLEVQLILWLDFDSLAYNDVGANSISLDGGVTWSSLDGIQTFTLPAMRPVPPAVPPSVCCYHLGVGFDFTAGDGIRFNAGLSGLGDCALALPADAECLTGLSVGWRWAPSPYAGVYGPNTADQSTLTWYGSTRADPVPYPTSGNGGVNGWYVQVRVDLQGFTIGDQWFWIPPGMTTAGPPAGFAIATAGGPENVVAANGPHVAGPYTAPDGTWTVGFGPDGLGTNPEDGVLITGRLPGLSVEHWPALAPAPGLTPANDDAPWYDPAVPESADFLGLWITELLTPTPYQRTMRSTQRGGSAAAPLWGPREVHVTGWLLARNARAAAYGREWLMEALIDGNCSGGCDLPDLTMYRTCCGTADEEVRTLKRVALTAAPNWNLEPEFPGYAGLKFELTLQAEQPFFYRDPVAVANGLVYDLIADAECNFCSGCPDPDAGGGCLCGALAAPERIATRDQSADDWCSPLLVRRRYVPVPPAPAWSSAAAIVKIKAGTLDTALGGRGVSNLRLRAFSNPLGLTSPLVTSGDEMIDYRSYFICGDPCMSIEVSCLPPDSELVIDATTRSATLTCGNVTSSGYRYLSSNDGSAFRWPEFDCSGLMVVIEADDQNTAPDTTFQVLAVGRDRS